MKCQASFSLRKIIKEKQNVDKKFVGTFWGIDTIKGEAFHKMGLI